MSINKTIILLLLIFIELFLISCSNPNEPEQKNPVFNTNRIYSSMDHIISDSDLNLVLTLFQKNNINLENLKIELLTKDIYSLGDRYVFCDQFYKGLLYFDSRVIFWFNKEDSLYNQVGELYTNFSINVTPKISEYDASNLFYHKIASDSLFIDSLQSFITKGSNAELGIFNLNIGNNSTSQNFVLAWKLTIANGTKYPTAMIRADSLSFIYYSSRAPVR